MPKSKPMPSQMVVPEAFGTLGLDVIPSMPLEDRLKLIHNLGHPKQFQLPMAIQDRASSILHQLSLLVEQPGNAQLIEQANAWLNSWNKECEPIFLEMFRVEIEGAQSRQTEREKPFPGWPMEPKKA